MASLAIELEGEVEDDLYLDTVKSHLPAVIESHRPKLVIYVAGADPAADDKLGNGRISAAGMLERDRFVVSELERASRPPLVVVLDLSPQHLGQLALAQVKARAQPPDRSAIRKRLLDLLSLGLAGLFFARPAGCGAIVRNRV